MVCGLDGDLGACRCGCITWSFATLFFWVGFGVGAWVSQEKYHTEKHSTKLHGHSAVGHFLNIERFCQLDTNFIRRSKALDR